MMLLMLGSLQHIGNWSFLRVSYHWQTNELQTNLNLLWGLSLSQGPKLVEQIQAMEFTKHVFTVFIKKLNLIYFIFILINLI